MEDLQHVLTVNVVGTFAVSKAFLPLLRTGSKKTVVNISSDAGCHMQNASFIHSASPSEGGVGLSYRTSKAALNMRNAFSTLHVLTWSLGSCYENKDNGEEA